MGELLLGCQMAFAIMLPFGLVVVDGAHVARGLLLLSISSGGFALSTVGRRLVTARPYRKGPGRLRRWELRTPAGSRGFFARWPAVLLARKTPGRVTVLDVRTGKVAYHR